MAIMTRCYGVRALNVVKPAFSVTEGSVSGPFMASEATV